MNSENNKLSNPLLVKYYMHCGMPKAEAVACTYGFPYVKLEPQANEVRLSARPKDSMQVFEEQRELAL